MSYILGLDLGTSALKGLLFNENGEMIGEASASYPLASPKAGYSEQEPDHWLQAAENVMTNLIQAHPEMKEELIGISFSGQMHSMVLLNAANQVLRPAILWNDVRTTVQCQKIMAKYGDRLLEITKNKALEGFTLSKILWIQEEEPDLWAQTAHLMLPKDYLAFWLTGKYSTDYSDAAGTLLLDIEGKRWSDEILQTFEISATILPSLYDSAEEVGMILPELQEKFGFTHSVKVYAGGADNACAALGAGIIAEGVGMVSIGTSGVFLSYEPTAEINYHGDLHLFCHAAKDQMYAMGVTLAAGNSLSWFKETFAPEKSFDDLLHGSKEIPIGSDGLLFTPYIVGERTPYTDSQIRGSFIGIDTRHRLDHFARAVLEGITFSLKDSQGLMENTANRTFNTIISVGGGAKNPTWLQMQADIFDAEIKTLSTEQGPGMGAAMLAAIGSGLFKNEADCVNTFVSYGKTVTPIPENVAKYRQIYAVYQQVYPQTADLSHQLQELK